MLLLVKNKKIGKDMKDIIIVDNSLILIIKDYYNFIIYIPNILNKLFLEIICYC